MTAEMKPVSGIDAVRGFCQSFLTEEFWNTQWEKVPLHYKASEHGKEANRLPDCLTVDEVMRMYRKSGGNLKMFKSGQPANFPDFMVAYLEGVSLVINQADRTSDILMDMCRVLSKMYFLHTFCVAYLTPPGSQAVRLHNDDQDVFLLQVWGKKHWKVRNAPQLPIYSEEMLGKDEPVPPEVIEDPIMDFTIEPYDILYLPRGYLHEATTSTELSLHITVTMPTSDYCWGVQMVRDFMDQLKTSASPLKSTLAKALQAPAGEDADENAEQELKAIATAWASDLKIDRVLDNFQKRMDATNEGQERQHAQFSKIKSPPHVTENGKVRLMNGISCFCHPNKDLALFVKEEGNQQMELPLARTAMPLLKALTNRPQLVRDLPCDDPFERVCVLQLLNNQGVVQMFVAGDGEEADVEAPPSGVDAESENFIS
mmetsp:Transcript_37504/g.79550  ORF Transcript_37504/g.79550 Transcript_37504/m.79550 type:complete len:428 (-) Transcript_37504:44-1327(-)